MTYSGEEIPLPVTSNRQQDWGSIPGKGKKFSTSSKRQNRLWVSSNFLESR